MKLFLLTRKDDAKIRYDENDSFVIRARSNKVARVLANEIPGDEGNIWVDPAQVDCELLTVFGEEGVIIRNFNAG